MRRLIGILFLILLTCGVVKADDYNAAGNELNKNVQYNAQNGNKIIYNEKGLNLSLIPVLSAPVMPEGIIYQEVQKSYDSINPQKTTSAYAYYPGLRGPNQLVIYTPLYGHRTGTNEFGTEAIVENNMVVRLNGADSVIPKNGFVISGHGSAKKWITQNIQVGSKVYIDYTLGTIRVYLTPDSLVFAAKEKLSEVNDLIEYYKKFDILYNDKKASEFMDESKDYLRKAEKKPEKTQMYINNAMTSLNSAIKNAIPYNKDELKGIWVRPVEKTPYAIEKTVERIANSGITDVFLETYFHGKTIYPSEYLKNQGVIYQREEFMGFDPLEIWIRECHKRNMKLHVWFETYYVGNENPQTTPNHVLSVYPMWGNRRFSNYNSENLEPSLSEHNGYFLDPANLQVKAYLIGLLEEIITKYKPDGINLDYIRYPQTVDSSYSNYAQMNWGYTQIARDEFMSIYGIDPIDIKYGTGDWELWASYRQNKISDFVKEVQKLTKTANIKLTAVIFPDLKKSVMTKMQNWRDWSINNYVDGLTPLILTGDKNTANVLLSDVINNTVNTTKIYAGLFVTFMGGADEDLLVQIHKAREYNLKGEILFDYAHFDDKYIDALKTRVFNKSYDVKEDKINDYKPEVIYKDKKKKKKNKRNN